jgi:hypothetical protein
MFIQIHTLSSLKNLRFDLRNCTEGLSFTKQQQQITERINSILLRSCLYVVGPLENVQWGVYKFGSGQWLDVNHRGI